MENWPTLETPQAHTQSKEDGEAGRWLPEQTALLAVGTRISVTPLWVSFLHFLLRTQGPSPSTRAGPRCLFFLQSFSAPEQKVC